MQTFASFQPGEMIGTDRQCVSDSLIAQWNKIYKMSAGARTEIPAGLLSVIVMRAYCNVLSARPPGNVHVGQKLVAHRKPLIGEELLVHLRCINKRTGKSRLVVEFGVEMRSVPHGDRLVEGAIVMLWAA